MFAQHNIAISIAISTTMNIAMNIAMNTAMSIGVVRTFVYIGLLHLSAAAVAGAEREYFTQTQGLYFCKRKKV